MAMWTQNFGMLLLAYGIGSVPFGVIIGKMNGVDIQKHGSGNVGATNIMRICGKKWGYTCFFLDFCKGLCPVLIGRHLTQAQGGSNPSIVMILVAVGAVGGHVWSPFLRFRGGKGVATSAGVISGLAPLVILLVLATWYFTFSITRYVSLASIVAAISLPLYALALNLIFYRESIRGIQRPVIGLFFILSAAVVVLHRANIQRLLRGTENQFEKKNTTP